MGGRFSATVQTGLGAHPASCTMGTGSFPGVNRPECGAHIAPRLKKEYSYVSTPPLGSRGLLKGELYLNLSTEKKQNVHILTLYINPLAIPCPHSNTLYINPLAIPCPQSNSLSKPSHNTLSLILMSALNTNVAQTAMNKITY